MSFAGVAIFKNVNDDYYWDLFEYYLESNPIFAELNRIQLISTIILFENSTKYSIETIPNGCI